MSAKHMGEVFDLDLPHAEMLVLLAMADHADHLAMNVRPGLPLIAWKTGYSLRQVRRIIGRLIKRRLLVLLEAHHGAPRHYGLDLSKASRKPPMGHVELEVMGQDVRGVSGQNVRPDNWSGRTPRCPGGADTQMSGGADIQMSAKPSVTINNHTPTANADSTAVGGGGDRSMDWVDIRKRFVALLDELGVASGPKAALRWWRVAKTNKRIEYVDDAFTVVRYAVERARREGRTVNYASDVVEIVRWWSPPAGDADAESA